MRWVRATAASGMPASAGRAADAADILVAGPGLESALRSTGCRRGAGKIAWHTTASQSESGDFELLSDQSDPSFHPPNPFAPWPAPSAPPPATSPTLEDTARAAPSPTRVYQI